MLKIKSTQIVAFNFVQILLTDMKLETWVTGEKTISVISGEPGHGKTSLCRKAMCDFYKKGWLSGKVSNEFITKITV